MHDYAKLSDQARYEIEDLQAAGITPTPDEIVELSAIGWQVETPQTRIYLSRGLPVKCGSVTLWPMTLQASDWYSRVGCKLEGLERHALGYAMAHCYDTAQRYHEDTEDAETAVNVWAMGIDATDAALTEAISQVLQQSEQPEMPPNPNEKKGSMTAGELSANLAALCGGDPAFWEARCASDYAIDVMTAVMSQRNESGKPLPTDPRIQAVRALGWAVEKIKQRHEGASDGN